MCHEWALSWAGSEQVAKRLVEALDAPDVYTYARDPEIAALLFPGRRVFSSRLGRTRFARRRWRYLLPLMGHWWRSLDLSRYDVVVTCSHAAVNSVRTRGAVHVSYCCTPMRYAWEWRNELGRMPPLLRPISPVIAALLRIADRRRGRNVDAFMAVSEHVAERIHTAYGRSSVVVYPPVDTTFFVPDDHVGKGDFFLYAGRLVAYKRADRAVRAANLAGVRLVVAGSGPELERLRALAGPGVTFVEGASNDELRDLFRRARALVFPGIEDFGMVLVEAQACGTPVIAFAEGGACEAVRDGETGVLYRDGSDEGLARVLASFDDAGFEPAVVRRFAERFSKERFSDEVQTFVRRCAARSPTA